ncbi:MAG: recombinase family protein [Pseudonocardiaceae bacterium]
MLHGYARVSTVEQNPDAQRDALLRAGVHPDQLYTDHTSGAKSSRPGWNALYKALRSGDVLVATPLDRVGRATVHLVALLDELARRGVAFRFLEQGIDTTTSEGRLMYRMPAAIAEFQRDLIVANTREGRLPHLRNRARGCPDPVADAQTRWRLRQDLATVWLHLDGEDLREQRHCVACQPHIQPLIIECDLCGDGPLVTGLPAGLPTEKWPAGLTSWLRNHDWRTGPDRTLAVNVHKQTTSPLTNVSSCK